MLGKHLHREFRLDLPRFILGELVEELGIEMDQAHITITVDIASLDDERRRKDQDTVLRDLDMLSELGITHGVLHPGGFGQRQTLDDVKRQNDVRLEAVSTLAAAAERAGVCLALENGIRTTGPDGAITWSGDITGLRAFIAEIGSPALGTCRFTAVRPSMIGWRNRASRRAMSPCTAHRPTAAATRNRVGSKQITA